MERCPLLPLGDTRIMCRIDPAIHGQVVQIVGVETVHQMKGRDYIGWVYVDRSDRSDKRKPTQWIKLALDYNSTIQ